MRASEHSELLPEIYFFDYTAEKHIENGSHPPSGGAHGSRRRKQAAGRAKRGIRRLLPPSARVGQGGGVRESAASCIAKRCSAPRARTTYPRARPRLSCPPRGRRERAPASVGKDKAALADTALPSCLQAGGAHVAAEPTAAPRR